MVESELKEKFLKGCNKEKEIGKCITELGQTQGTIIGVLWEASEGDWIEARRSIEHRLKPKVKELEDCIKKDLPIVDKQIRKMEEFIEKKDLGHLISASKTLSTRLPIDMYKKKKEKVRV